MRQMKYVPTLISNKVFTYKDAAMCDLLIIIKFVDLKFLIKFLGDA
jgi:hypothetical protein